MTALALATRPVAWGRHRLAGLGRARPRGHRGRRELQLLQPFFGLALAGWLLGEPVAPSMPAVTGLVVLCVAGAKTFA